jgi:hypothetical protein
MNFEYVKKHYQVPACIGRIIEFNRKTGVITEDRGNYIGVNFDKDKPGVIYNVHPTDNVKYLGIGKIRKITKSQQRYQDYLKVSDCYDNFANYLGINT